MSASYLIRMLCRAGAAAAVTAALGSTPAMAQNVAQKVAHNAGAQLQTVPRDVQFARAQVIQTKDHQGLPFAMVDKKSAQLFVFNSSGYLQGSAPALLGLTPGDVELAEATGGDMQSLPTSRRTTPAGRFVSEPGRNLGGEAIVWIDYAARLAIHRLRPAAQAERRAERLASATPLDNRITLGCVVVDPLFYDTVVAPVLGKGYGVVYVLPENEALERLRAATR